LLAAKLELSQIELAYDEKLAAVADEQLKRP
jgi:hypothetical protein